MDIKFVDGNNSFIARFIKSLKTTDNFSGVSFILRKSSSPIDVADIMKKYNRVPRKITSNQFLGCYIMSHFLRLAIETLKEIEGDYTLIEQDVLSAHWALSYKIFWTDNKAFLWYIEYANKWVFRLGCQIRVGILEDREILSR